MAAGDEILAMIKEVQEAEPEEITDCPLCGCSLNRFPDGNLHCKFDGWTSGMGAKK